MATSSPDTRYTYKLYTYFRSSCSARVRIAAHSKGLPLEYSFIHLVKGDQLESDYSTLNPSKSVPTLVVIDKQTGKDILTIRQSVAILEYMEEARPDLPPLLPPNDPIGRAKVRELVNIISNDVQPITNLRTLSFAKERGVDGPEWQQHFMRLGFNAYEQLLKLYAGKYSVGDQVTMADCILAPAVDGAVRFGVEVEQDFPNIWRVWQNLNELDAFQKGRWNAQADTPEDLRGK
ncbi:hypothetical protein B0A52_03190 [Exophiala mesophila]|uniref:Maleylacetoacetate isomerase n=1 Tax=Exophiala mesophila TaxID=212818 RepID=A0A438NB23_EXOME|nr:hypothetical protein B0A52_03190 [Exophiala mesophila]